MIKKILPVILLLIVLGCDLGIPTWDVSFNLKFLNDDYGVEELAETDTALVVNIEGNIEFHETIDESQEIGEFDIEPPEEKNTAVIMSEFAPGLDQYNGITVGNLPPVAQEPFVLIELEKQLDTFEEFEVITFSKGFINITVTNNTVIWLGNDVTGPFFIDVIDSETSIVLKSVQFDQHIAPNGGIGNKVVDLTDDTFPDSLKLRFCGGSKVTDDGSQIIDTSALVLISVLLDDVAAKYAIAPIPSQEIDEIDGALEIDIDYPEIDGTFDFVGYTEIIFNTYSPIPATIDMELIASNDSVEVVGDPLSIDIPEGNAVTVLPSTVYNMNNLLEIFPDTLSYVIQPTIHGEDQLYELYDTDEVTADIELIAELQIQTELTGIWILPKDNGEYKISKVDVKDFDQSIYDTFKKGVFYFEYLNSTGVQLYADVLISDDSLSIFQEMRHYYNTDTTKVKLFEIPSIETTNDTIFKSIEIEINQDDLNYFLADFVFIFQRLNFYSSGQNPISGGLKIRGEINVDLTIGSHLVKN